MIEDKGAKLRETYEYEVRQWNEQRNDLEQQVKDGHEEVDFLKSKMEMRVQEKMYEVLMGNEKEKMEAALELERAKNEGQTQQKELKMIYEQEKM
jgi:hypothetical protein